MAHQATAQKKGQQQLLFPQIKNHGTLDKEARDANERRMGQGSFWGGGGPGGMGGWVQPPEGTLGYVTCALSSPPVVLSI